MSISRASHLSYKILSPLCSLKLMLLKFSVFLSSSSSFSLFLCSSCFLVSLVFFLSFLVLLSSHHLGCVFLLLLVCDRGSVCWLIYHIDLTDEVNGNIMVAGH
jgi:hypothetical protein